MRRYVLGWVAWQSCRAGARPMICCRANVSWAMCDGRDEELLPAPAQLAACQLTGLM
jgi:hypothetical protein